MRPCKASKLGTMQFISAAAESPDLVLRAFELSLANTANPPVIERIPFPESVSCTQDRQPIVELNISCHNTEKLCALQRNKQSGRRMIE